MAVDFVGPSSYSFQNGVTINAPSLLNRSLTATSGTVQLQFWLLTEPYTGARPKGVEIESISIGSLAPYSVRQAGQFVFRLDLTKFPLGDSCVALLLADTNGSIISFDDWINYSDKVHVVVFPEGSDHKVISTFRDGGPGGGVDASDQGANQTETANDNGGAYGSNYVPVRPASLTASSTTATSTVLSWQAAIIPGGDTVAQYVVYENGVALATVQSTSYVVAGLIPSSNYTFTVAAHDDAGNSLLADPVAVMTATAVPTSPTGLAASSVTSMGLTLSWQASSVPGGGSASSYTVYDNGGAIGQTRATSLDVGNLAPSSNNTFTVVASNAAGTSSASAPLLVTTFSGLPTPPSGLVATGATSSGITLGWQPASVPGGGTVIDYIVYQNGTYLARTTGTTYLVTGLAPLAAYSFAVAAEDAAGLSAPSPAISVGTAGSVPTTPAKLAASATTFATTVLSWQASDVPGGGAVDDYVIYQNGAAIAITGATSYIVSGLAPATAYAFAIAAQDASGVSPPTIPVVVTTGAPSATALPDLSSLLSPVARAAVHQIESYLTASTTAVRMVNISSGDTRQLAIPGALNGLSVMAATAGSSTALPTGYRVGYLLGGGPALFADATGGNLLVAVTATATLFGASNDTFIGGGGSVTFVDSGSAGNIVGGEGENRMFLNAAQSFVTSQGTDTIVGVVGSATIAAGGNALVFGGTGSLVFQNGAGASTVVSGAGSTATVAGGTGALLAFGGAATWYIPGSAIDTVLGYGGSLTATGGANGALFFGGAAGHNRVDTGAGSTTIVGGGDGDVLTATGSGRNVIAAGVGQATIDGSTATGSNVFFAGSGRDCLVGGIGDTVLVAGSGDGTLVGGSGSTLFDIPAGSPNRTLAVIGFDADRDFVMLPGYGDGTGKTALAEGFFGIGSTRITLPDGTAIYFHGVLNITDNNFL